MFVALPITFTAISLPPQDDPKCWLVKGQKEGDPPELQCEDDIVVTGESQRDVITSIQPIAVLNAQDVAALGAFTDITNIANARPRVRDGAGNTPLFYQPAYLDPRGRTVTLRLRKQL